MSSDFFVGPVAPSFQCLTRAPVPSSNGIPFSGAQITWGGKNLQFSTENTVLSRKPHFTVRRLDTGRLRCPVSHLTHNLLPHYLVSCAGSGVVRIDPLRFLAGCRKSRLNRALSALSLSLGIFLSVSVVLLTRAHFSLYCCVLFGGLV